MSAVTEMSDPLWLFASESEGCSRVYDQTGICTAPRVHGRFELHVSGWHVEPLNLGVVIVQMNDIGALERHNETIRRSFVFGCHDDCDVQRIGIAKFDDAEELAAARPKERGATAVTEGAE
jgi:hypothetical protein